MGDISEFVVNWTKSRYGRKAENQQMVFQNLASSVWNYSELWTYPNRDWQKTAGLHNINR